MVARLRVLDKLRSLTSWGEYLRKHWRAVVLFIVALAALSLIGWAAYLRWGLYRPWADWTGFRQYTGKVPKDDRGKTLWDWLQLLIIPIVLALGTFWLQWSEKERERRLAGLRHKEDQERLRDQQRQTVLQSYVDKITEMLLDKEHPLRQSKPDDEVIVVARTRTLAALRELDGERRGLLLKFLYEAKLITADTSKPIEERIEERKVESAEALPILALVGANLSKANLILANLNKAYLKETNLSFSRLRRAFMREANLTMADLSGADIQLASLNGAFMDLADLRGANLTRAYLQGVRMISATLDGANLEFAAMHGIILIGATLIKANLRNASLHKADLREADLRGADLCGAYLAGANIESANVTEEQLSTARSLENAIMPNGQKFDPDIHTFWKGLSADSEEEKGEDQ